MNRFKRWENYDYPLERLIRFIRMYQKIQQSSWCIDPDRGAKTWIELVIFYGGVHPPSSPARNKKNKSQGYVICFSLICCHLWNNGLHKFSGLVSLIPSPFVDYTGHVFVVCSFFAFQTCSSSRIYASILLPDIFVPIRDSIQCRFWTVVVAHGCQRNFLLAEY